MPKSSLYLQDCRNAFGICIFWCSSLVPVSFATSAVCPFVCVNSRTATGILWNLALESIVKIVDSLQFSFYSDIPKIKCTYIKTNAQFRLHFGGKYLKTLIRKKYFGQHMWRKILLVNFFVKQYFRESFGSSYNERKGFLCLSPRTLLKFETISLTWILCWRLLRAPPPFSFLLFINEDSRKTKPRAIIRVPEFLPHAYISYLVS